MGGLFVRSIRPGDSSASAFWSRCTTSTTSTAGHRGEGGVHAWDGTSGLADKDLGIIGNLT
jgi:hypothetical protein